MLHFELNEEEILKNLSQIGRLTQKFKVQNPKICFFGDKNKIMCFDINAQKWELTNYYGDHEFKYYAAAVSIPDGSVLIVGGGSSNIVL